MINWIKQNRREFLAIIFILLLATFLRFYKLDEYMTFLGDEGRDALIIKKILVERDLPFIGPPTSIGNIYLGPLYYYMMTVPMAIFWLNPVSAAAMVALIGVATIGLLYYLARSWFGAKAALLVALLYTVSPVTIIYSRHSWNPNPAPFFALLAVLGFYLARQKRDFRWLLLVGLSLAFIVQMHYLALILLPIFTAFWIHELVLQFKEKIYHHFILGSLLAFTSFTLLMLPLVLFDLKHNFANYRALMMFFGERETTVNLNIINSILRVFPIYRDKLLGHFIGVNNEIITGLLVILILVPVVMNFSKIKNQLFSSRFPQWPYFVLGIWLVGSMLGLSLYKQSVYDHYLGFVSPAPYLLLAGLIVSFKHKWLELSILVIVIVLVVLNLQKSPLLSPGGRQLERTQKVAEFIISKSENKPFNFALISKSNYDAAYQYYLDLYGHKPAVLPDKKTDQLWVVCEDPVCKPVGHPKHEIAAFGWTRLDMEYEILGLKVYKLIPNPHENK